MAATLGNRVKAYIRVVTTNPAATTYTWLGCETGNSVNRTQEAVECSDKSSDWAQFLSAKRGGTFEVTAYADNSDAQQQAVLKGLHNGSNVDIFIGSLDDGEPLDGEFGSCVVTAISDTNDFGAVASRTMSLTVDGELTHYPEEDLEEE